MCASLKTLVCLLKRVATKCSFELNHFSLEMHLIWHHLENLGFSHNISVINQLMHYFFKNLFVTKKKEKKISCHFFYLFWYKLPSFSKNIRLILVLFWHQWYVGKLCWQCIYLHLFKNHFKKGQRIVFKTNMGVPWCY